MARRILIIAAVLIVAGFLYLGYTSYDAGRAAANGEVYSNDPPSGKRTSGDGTSEKRTSTSTDSQTVVYPPFGQATAAPSEDQTSPSGTSAARTATGMLPSTDSINPNPPNGMAFSGSGKYQLYRQGNITWRLDTETGRTCIIFATEEEWKKPQVLRAGCGKS